MHRHTFKNQRHHWIGKSIAFIVHLSFLLNFRRIVMRFLPFLKLQSRVRNIVYLSWLIDIVQVRSRYPQSVKLLEKQNKTIFTILTYQHEHFGFSFLGWFRKLMPSPKQSNWRFYIDPIQQEKTVIFEQVIVDQMLYVLSGRLASDAMPAQLAKPFEHLVQDQKIHTALTVDQHYQLQSSVQIDVEKRLPKTWQDLFYSWDDAVRFLVDQDHAWVEWVDQPEKLSQGDIEMPFDFSQIQAAQVLNIHCPLLKEWGMNEQEAFAFVVPELDFYVKNEYPLK